MLDTVITVAILNNNVTPGNIYCLAGKCLDNFKCIKKIIAEIPSVTAKTVILPDVKIY